MRSPISASIAAPALVKADRLAVVVHHDILGPSPRPVRHAQDLVVTGLAGGERAWRRWLGGWGVVGGGGKGAVRVGPLLLDLGFLERGAGSFVQKSAFLDCHLNDFVKAAGGDGLELQGEGEQVDGLLAEI